MTNRYDDIIHLPHPLSARRPLMPRENRAAQFAPFAALTGYEEAVLETARLTDRRIEADEDTLALLNDQLHTMLSSEKHPQAVFTVFEPDERKDGGAYVQITGRIRRIDEVARMVYLTDRTVLDMERILSIDLPLLENDG